MWAAPIGLLAGATALLGIGPVAANAATTVAGTTFYVDCSQKTNGNGTIQSPWNSTWAVNTHGAFAPGDHILLKRTKTCSGQLLPAGSGVSGSPIVLGAYGSGARPIVKAGGTKANGTGAVQLTNQHDWTVQDLHLTNSDSSKTSKYYRSGLLIQNISGKRLANITAKGILVDKVTSRLAPGYHGARLYGGISVLTFGKSGDGFTNLKILNNQVNRVGRTGIIVDNTEYPKSSDSKVQIANNSVQWARGDSIVLLGSKNARINNNVSGHGAAFWPCSECKGISPETANAGIWTASSDGVVIEHNEVYAEHFKGGDGEAFDIDMSARHVTVQYNYAHDNEGGGVLLCGARDSTVRYNILQNNAKAAITFTCKTATKNITITNNTIYAAKTIKTNFVVRTIKGYGATGMRFTNNIVYSYGASRYTWPSTHPTLTSNTFVGNHTLEEPHAAGTSRIAPKLKKPGSGKTGMSTLSGYKYKTTSGAKKGIAISSAVKLDFFGKKVNPKSPYRGASNSK